MVTQTGLIVEKKLKDYVAGVSSPIFWEDLMPSSDWRLYLPTNEKQYLQWTFDTLSCATFSALNAIEIIINYYIQKEKLPVGTLEKLNKLGYLENGKANFSDRHIAIISGTTDKGNTSQNVLDAVRKQGLIPEKDLPFGGKTQLEYLSANITKEIKDKALSFLDMFAISYEFTPVDDSMLTALRHSPLNVAISKEYPTHAIILPKMDYLYDTYPPFLFFRNTTINYAIKIKVEIKKLQKYTYFDTKTDPKMIGVSDELMILLDAMRSECGFPFKIVSGYRTVAYNATLKDAVEDSAHTLGLAVDLYCVDSAKRDAIVNTAKKQGITRIGLGATFVHVDIDQSKPQNRMWLY